MDSIAVIDYGMGNLHSVAKAVEREAPAGSRVVVGDEPDAIAAATRVVFPGQGAARDCMAAIDARRLRGPLRAALAEKPFLGICMGLQVLLDRSAENGGIDCLGHFAGEVLALPRGRRDPATGQRLSIPAMGWNPVRQRPHPLWSGIADGSHFYYAHSYYAAPRDPGAVIGESRYPEPFAGALARENVFACQFHPEKSAQQGLRLLHNFLRWRP